MRFSLIDRIVELQPGKHIIAHKSLSLGEDYLQDHFPQFPVMPGVLMLEAMSQASAWLVRKSENFANSIVLLREARNVKYAKFVEPGEVLVVTAEIIKHDSSTTQLKVSGCVNDVDAVRARLVLERFNQSDSDPGCKGIDQYTRWRMTEEFKQIYQPSNSLDTTGLQAAS